MRTARLFGAHGLDPAGRIFKRWKDIGVHQLEGQYDPYLGCGD